MFEHIHNPGARVRALCEYGGQVEVDSAIPPRRYFRSGHEMLRMASVYVDENKLEQAFILYTKFITLFVEKLPKHPEYKTVIGREKTVNKQKLKDVFPKAEALKKKLMEKYEVLEIKQQKELERQKQEEKNRLQEEQRIREQMRIAELNREVDDKEKMRQEYGNQMIQEQEEQYRQLQELERQKLKEKDNMADVTTGMSSVSVDQHYEDAKLPPPPAYGNVTEDSNKYPPVPIIPSRDLKPTPSAPVLPPIDPTAQMPAVDRSNKPHHFTSVGDTSNPYSLRGVHVPTNLMKRFLEIAMTNTVRNLETGGFLFGTLSNDTLKVTHLIIPQQTGSSDSFSDLSKEDELWEIQEKYNVIQLGWIHTHPSQTAFLSSVDQHVQASFQCMLPESIAIVCAPKHKETGIFFLTPDYGLDFIRKCKQKGFHPHPSSPDIFEACRHVALNPNGDVTVIDLRT